MCIALPQFKVQIDKLAATMIGAKLNDPTLVIHDWGSFLGYQITHQYPQVMYLCIYVRCPVSPVY